MVDVRAADDAEAKAWTRSYDDRVRSWYARFDRSSEWFDRQVARKIGAPADPTLHVFVLVDGNTAVGFVALGLVPFGGTMSAILKDLWVHPDHRRRGIGTFARGWAEAWGAERSPSLYVTIDPGDSALAALFASYPVRAQTMMKRLEPPGPLPADVEGRPMTEAEFASWREATVLGYAASIAGSGSMSHEDALVRSRTQTAELLPLGLGTPGHTFWTIFADGEAVATNWLRHQYEPGTSFIFGVETHEQFRGKGYGRAAMVVGETAALAAGDTHLALNVFGHNQVAINLYVDMGYQPVEQGRSITR
jgi:ribosomal protein S18 acetylase RimI-like enzyme